MVPMGLLCPDKEIAKAAFEPIDRPVGGFFINTALSENNAKCVHGTATAQAADGEEVTAKTASVQ